MEKQQLAKLKWRCRRGTKELDIMLTRFVDTRIDNLSVAQIRSFKQLLKQQDPELNQWLMEQQQPQDKGLSEIVRLIRQANNM